MATEKTYDVIIAGGSFAGLAVASQLRGKVLLVEPNGRRLPKVRAREYDR